MPGWIRALRLAAATCTLAQVTRARRAFVAEADMSQRSSDTKPPALRSVLLGVALAAGACAHRRAEPFMVLSGVMERAASPAPVAVAQDGHTAPVAAIDIDPTGTLVVTAAGAELLLWEVASGRVQARIDNIDGAIRDVAFSWADPIALGTFDAMSVLYADDWGLKRWSLDTDVVLPIARDVTRVVTGNAGEIGAAQDNHLLYGEHRRELWHGLGPRDVRQPPALRSFLHVSNPIEHIGVTQWEPCMSSGCWAARRAVVSDRRGQIVAVDLNNGRTLAVREQLDPCGSGPLALSPTSLALSLDGLRVAAAFPGRVIVWEIDTVRRMTPPMMWRARPHRGACLRAQDSSGPLDVAIAALQFDYDGESVSLVGADGSVRAWDLEADRMVVEAAPAPASAGRGQAAFSVTRGWLAFEEAGEVTVRNLWTGSVVARFPVTGPRRKIVAVALSPQRQLAVAREDRVEVWDLDGGTLECPDGLASHAAWSPDGRKLAAWERQDGPAVATPRLLVRTIEPVDERATRALTIADAEFPWPPIAWADARHVLVPVGSSLALWDVEAGVRVRAIALDREARATVRSLAAASGRAAAIVRGPRGERLFSLDLADPRTRDSVPVPPTSGPVAVSPDGLRLGTTHGAHPTTIWDARELQPIVVEIPSTTKPSVDELVALTPGGTVIGRITGGRVWLRMTDNRRVELHSRPIAADVAADGQLVAIAAADGVHLQHLGDSKRGGVHLVSASGGRCQGLVFADDGRIDASGAEPSSLFVRLGSPFAGALVPASALPATSRREHLLRDFADGVPLPATHESANPPELRDVRQYGRRVIVDLAPTRHGSGTLCVELRPADGSPAIERCVDTDPRRQILDVPDVALDGIWVRACDASRTVCGRSIRARGFHSARGWRRGH
jgi:WD40 repeat protein